MKFDLAVIASPRVEVWPSIGVRTLAMMATDMGLSVGVFGGSTFSVKGVIPQAGSGGLIIVEDAQQRLHRIQARAIVRVSPPAEISDPFEGSHSEGLIPYSTARRLKKQVSVDYWKPGVVLLGSGNRALRMGSQLMEAGIENVVALEAGGAWEGKRSPAWEVETRRFEILGGKIVFGRPERLEYLAPMRWRMHWSEGTSKNSLEVGRVVSVGPFLKPSGVRQHASGALLFELDQIALEDRDSDFEGWVLEQERGRWLAGKIVRSLVSDLGTRRDALSKLFLRAKGRLKRYTRHLSQPFELRFEGKWLARSVADAFRLSPGAPKHKQQQTLVAAIDCVEDIPCTLCQTACPEGAIDRGRVLIEDRCTACGICLQACPSQSIVMVHEPKDQTIGKIVFPYLENSPAPEWKNLAEGDFVSLVNRRGDTLSSARVLKLEHPDASQPWNPALVSVEVPHHLIHEARGIKPPKLPQDSDQLLLGESGFFDGKVEVMLDGERRFVREGITVNTALFETGRARPQDVLSCPDGSCRRCMVSVDGVRKLACQATTHRGMTIEREKVPDVPLPSDLICPCSGVTRAQIIERIRDGQLRTPDAVAAATGVGGGTCHGQMCLGAFRRVLDSQGFEVDSWSDWRFPWVDWNRQ